MCLSADAIAAYEWLVSFLLCESSNKLREELSRGKDNFTARNDSQVYYCRTLSIAFIEVRSAMGGGSGGGLGMGPPLPQGSTLEGSTQICGQSP